MRGREKGARRRRRCDGEGGKRWVTKIKEVEGGRKER